MRGQPLTSARGLRNNIEWLQRVCDETSTDSDRHEILLALLTLVENALSDASVLVGPRLWDSVNGFIQQIRHNGGDAADRQRVLQLIDDYHYFLRSPPFSPSTMRTPARALAG